MLSPAQIEAREGKLTASRVACLMTGDEAAIINLWNEMVGDPAFVPEDLSGVWPVQLGSATEQLNLDWFARKHGPVTRRGEVVIGDPDWMACTLDGWSTAHHCPIECKHVGGREPLDVVIDRYQPQMQWQMLVTHTIQCAISIIMGTNEPIVEFIPLDREYSAELSKRAHAFWLCVRSLTPAVAAAPIPAPIISVKTYDMAGNNRWGNEAATWLDTRHNHKLFVAAEKALKELVPADAIYCHGYGVEARRNRAGHLSLKESTQ